MKYSKSSDRILEFIDACVWYKFPFEKVRAQDHMHTRKRVVARHLNSTAPTIASHLNLQLCLAR